MFWSLDRGYGTWGKSYCYSLSVCASLQRGVNLKLVGYWRNEAYHWIKCEDLDAVQRAYMCTRCGSGLSFYGPWGGFGARAYELISLLDDGTLHNQFIAAHKGCQPGASEEYLKRWVI